MADARCTGYHKYVSTACAHDRHHRCRRTCKFCGTGCLCPCHKDDLPPEPLGDQPKVGGTPWPLQMLVREPGSDPEHPHVGKKSLNGPWEYEDYVPQSRVEAARRRLERFMELTDPISGGPERDNPREAVREALQELRGR